MRLVLYFALVFISWVCVFCQTPSNTHPEFTMNKVLTDKIINAMKTAENQARANFEKKMKKFYEDYKKQSTISEIAFQNVNITDFTVPSNVKTLQESMRDLFGQFKTNFTSVLTTSQQTTNQKQKIAPGITFRYPAKSCRQVLFNSKGQSSAPNGLYWINPNSPAVSSFDTSQQNCFMTYGGYSLISKIGSNVTEEKLLTVEKFV